MTHADSRTRRRRIADRLAAGENPETIAVAEAVTPKYVHACAKEFGVEYRRPDPTPPHPRTLAILADLINTADAQSDVARRYNVTPQWVSQIAIGAAEAGIKMPLRDA